MSRRWCAAVAMLILGAQTATSQECEIVEHLGQDFTICATDDPASIRLWLYDDSGTPISEFGALRAYLTPRGEQLMVATNGGMFHEDRRPVGLYATDGTELQSIITSDGPGNFGLLPNGVFCVTPDDRALVIESLAFVKAAPECRLATQSGPMLVIDGALHPDFMPDSTSRKRRNGIGVTEGGRVYLAISEGFVRFHDFATLFRDKLGTPNALFLEGSISRLYARGLGRSDTGVAMGPILGIVAPK